MIRTDTKKTKVFSNEDPDDEFARYRTYPLELKIEGGGDYLKTVIVNLYDIAEDLNRNPEYLFKYFGWKLNCKHQLLTERRAGVYNGKFDFEKVDKIFDSFLKEFVWCPVCKNPETNIVIDPKDKQKPIFLKCRACGENADAKVLSAKMTKLIYTKHKGKNTTDLMKEESEKKNMGIRVQVVENFDPWADKEVENEKGVNKIHIRIKKRSKRKKITIIEGLPKEFNLKRICKVLRKKFSCNASVATDSEIGKFITMQGDHRDVVKDFMVSSKMTTPSNIIIHGF